MNQVQRKYLIDKIQKASEEAIKEMRKSLPQKPELSRYCLMALLNGELKIKGNSELLQVLKNRALESNGSVFSHGWRSQEDGEITFRLEEFFEVPIGYTEAYSDWVKKSSAIKDKINLLEKQSEGLCTRIQLASNKTLERMIAEIDNMGDISLMDCTLKSLMSSDDALVKCSGDINIKEYGDV